jgi:hypothetical protein
VNFDADGQHDVNDLKEVKEYIKNYHKTDVFL